jgi:hypothetical protein
MRIPARDENQEFARFDHDLVGAHMDEATQKVQSTIRPVIHYRSVDGFEWSTKTRLAK